MPHTVKVGPFEGPLDLLLQLIEQEEVDVTAIALAQVCEGYIVNLRAVADRSPEEIADFLVVAAKLLYLKSLALVLGASAEPPEDTTGLTAQLRIYREFLEAAREVERHYAAGIILYGAERTPIAAPMFLPPPRLSVDRLHDAFAGVLAELEPIVRIPRAVIGRVISIDDRIAEIRQLIAEQPHASFADILRGRRSRQEAIVSFLAILELVKQREIVVTQEGRFEPITIAGASNQGSACPDRSIGGISLPRSEHRGNQDSEAPIIVA